MGCSGPDGEGRVGAGWGRAGWGGAGRVGAGRWGRTGSVPGLIHKNVRRNRVQCSFGAEYREKNPVFFTGFFPGGAGFSHFEGNIRGENLAKSRRNHRPARLRQDPALDDGSCGSSNVRAGAPRFLAHLLRLTPET